METGIQKDDEVAIMTLKNEIVAFGQSLMTTKEMNDTERGIAVKIARVFMKPGTYPKMERLPVEK